MPFRAYVYVFIHFIFGWFTNLTLLKKGNKNCPLHGPEITAPYTIIKWGMQAFG